MENDTRVEKDLIKEELCRLLSACYYEPENAFLEEDLFGRLAKGLELLEAGGVEEAREMEASFREEGAEKLLVDYSRLFLGPFDIRAKPYGSVYLDGPKVVMGDSTAALQELYRRGGFELAEDFKEMPDHIAVELEFLYLLSFKENEARAAGETDQLEGVSELKREFLGAHLGRWVEPFTEALRRGADTTFYRRLADITEAIVSLELAATKADRAA